MFIAVEKTNQDIFVELDTIKFHFRTQKYMDSNLYEWRINQTKDNYINVINEGTHCGYCCNNCSNPYRENINTHKHHEIVMQTNITPVFQYLCDMLESVQQELFEIKTGKWTVVVGTSYITFEADGFKSTTMFSKTHMKEFLKEFVRVVCA